VSFQPRETGQVDALVTDGYLESLLAARERRAHDAPSVAELDPGVRLAASRLAAAVIRVHPSFRFEERLAARLAEAADRMTLARAAGAEDAVVPVGSDIIDIGGRRIGPVGASGELEPFDPAHPEELPGLGRRPLLIGGTLASAALSIAGAAIVAWRINRAAHGGSERIRLA
jgi:hypothetical protein